MSVVLGRGSAEALILGVSGFGRAEQPFSRIDETQALKMIKEVFTLHLLYRTMVLVLLRRGQSLSPISLSRGLAVWDSHASHHGGLQLARAIRNSLVRGVDDYMVAIPWVIFTSENVLPRWRPQAGYVGFSGFYAVAVSVGVGTDDLDLQDGGVSQAAHFHPSITTLVDRIY